MKNFLYVYFIMAIFPVWVMSTVDFFRTTKDDYNSLIIAQISMFIISILITLLIKNIKAKQS